MADIPNTTGHGGLSVDRHTTDGITVVTPHGEVDFQAVPALQAALPPTAPVTRPRIVIDLSDVTFMDSSGINVLITAHRTLPEQGWLRLAAARTAVLRTLELVGLDAIMTVYPTVDDALTDPADSDTPPPGTA
ncbi:STAS domain-containing protein [Streptomyces sp. NPDC059582]|uniref:STAS domain-containing protein n=1 Tax=Streptomyces sp. NPDC059582 TaxID=3346875 RepID=UPI0036BFECAB